MIMMNNRFIASTLLALGGLLPTPSLSFHHQHRPSPSRLRTTARKLGAGDWLTDPEFVAGSFLWGLDFYYGFDWVLAPLGTGLDSDFNPAYRTATFFGRVFAGKSPIDAIQNLDIVGEDGDRPEMGSRIGSGANAAYVVAVENEEVEGADWLSDREAGLRSSAPVPLRVLVAALYAPVGVLAMSATDSLQTAAVLAIPALVYEIGRPSLPTREEAVLDAQLEAAVARFAGRNVLVYGQERLPDGVAPVKRDEAVNERELVNVFRRQLPPSSGVAGLSDFQVEMRFRELGTGRSEAGYIKGVRLLRKPLPEMKPESE